VISQIETGHTTKEFTRLSSSPIDIEYNLGAQPNLRILEVCRFTDSSFSVFVQSSRLGSFAFKSFRFGTGCCVDRFATSTEKFALEDFRFSLIGHCKHWKKFKWSVENQIWYHLGKALKFSG